MAATCIVLHYWLAAVVDSSECTCRMCLPHVESIGFTLVQPRPNVLQACERPEVMSAVFQCAEDSSKIAEYEHDPDVKMVCAWLFPGLILMHSPDASIHNLLCGLLGCFWIVVIERFKRCMQQSADNHHYWGHTTSITVIDNRHPYIICFCVAYASTLLVSAPASVLNSCDTC